MGIIIKYFFYFKVGESLLTMKLSQKFYSKLAFSFMWYRLTNQLSKWGICEGIESGILSYLNVIKYLSNKFHIIYGGIMVHQSYYFDNNKI